MKKILCLLLCFYSFIIIYVPKTTSFHARDIITNTGHSDILSLEFLPEYSSCKLLIDMNDYQIKKGYDEIEKRAWGWSAKAFTENAKANYVSEIIFSKANHSSNVIKYEYSLKTENTEEYQVSTSGNISLKFSGKIKGVNAQIDSSLKKDVLLKTKQIYEEKTDFDVIVPIGKKVTLRVTGECIVSNGVGKFFVFGIPFKKGTWEYIDKGTEYYELYEENI